MCFFCKTSELNTSKKKSKENMPSVVKKVKTAKEFKAALDSAGQKKVVVDFYATWCGPCKKAAPIYQDLAKKYGDTCVALSVDVDEMEEVAEKCGIKAMPTFHVYKTGNKVNELVGAPRKDQLEGLFKSK